MGNFLINGWQKWINRCVIGDGSMTGGTDERVNKEQDDTGS